MHQPVANPFSRYADKIEKKVDRLLRILSYKNRFSIQKKLLVLMQDNLVAVNLWQEKRFKGYKYLTKGKRNRFYKNTDIIIEEFTRYSTNFKFSDKTLFTQLSSLGFNPSTSEIRTKTKYLYSIMNFLKPGERYQYLEGASFGKLLSNITKEKMIGDCNQIVTFYTFLYSLKYPIRDLQIKLVPGHVCLHFHGIDIEATNGSFQNYTKYEKILPIVELISTNLLDTSDFRDKKLKIDARSFVKAAELAHQISSHTQIVENNLKAAYHNLALEASNKHDYATAKFYAGKIQDPGLRMNIYKNAVIYHTKNNNFQKARYFASLANDSELRRYINEQEGWHHFKNHNYTKARKIFNRTANKEMVKACYSKEYNEIQKRVSNLRTEDQHRAHKADYKKMLSLAGKMGDHKLQENIRNILSQLK